MNRLTATATMLLMVAVLALGACGDDNKPVASGGGRTTEPSEPASPAPPESAPTITGPIEVVTPAPMATDCEAIVEDPDETVSSDDSVPKKCTSGPVGEGGNVLIAAGTGKGDVDAASISVTADTELLVSDGDDGWEAGSFTDLAAGMTIRVWSDGEMAESYPVQFEADVIAYERTGSSTSSSVPTTSTPETSPPGSSDPGGSAGSDGGPPLSERTTVGLVESVSLSCPSTTTQPGTAGCAIDEQVGSMTVTGEAKAIDLVATFTPDTVFLRSDGSGGWIPASPDEIEVGSHVQVWVAGNVLTKSIPAQGVAGTVVIDG